MHKIVGLLISLIFISSIWSCQNEPAAPKATNTTLPSTGNPAIDGFTKEIAAQPNDPRLYAQRGALFYENENYDEAIKDLKKALHYDSTNVTYLHLLADSYLDYYQSYNCLLYTSPSPRDATLSRMPSSA